MAAKHYVMYPYLKIKSTSNINIHILGQMFGTQKGQIEMSNTGHI